MREENSWLTVGIGRRSVKGLVWRFPGPFLRVNWAAPGHWLFLIWVKIKMQNTVQNNLSALVGTYARVTLFYPRATRVNLTLAFFFFKTTLF